MNKPIVIGTNSELQAISVVLCTYNRHDMLSKALQSVANSAMPESITWEVMVVDNNSTDRTQEVAKDFCERYPNCFRYIFEPRQGKSHALNTGIRSARGEVLAFMDDDVCVEATWLRNLTAGLCSGEWVGAGGRILPAWPSAPPPWFPKKDYWYGMAPLAMFDLGPEAGPLTDAPFGTNMAFHRRMFEKYGDFRIDLGPRPNSEIRNEDTEFATRLMVAGERLRYEPTAVVYHAVPQQRLQREYFSAWWFDKGRANVLETGVPGDARWSACGIPLYLFPRLAMGILRWIITLKPSERFAYRLAVWLVAGMIVESHRQSREVGDRRKKPQKGL